VRIDPGRGAVAHLVPWRLGGGINPNSFALPGADLWVHAADGRLLRLDPHTGARRGTLSTPPDSRLVGATEDALVVAGSDGTVTRVDPASGRPLWTARLSSAPAGDNISRNFAIAGNTLWAVREDAVRRIERLTRIDLGNGRILGSMPLADVGADWLTVVGDQLWYASGFQTIALSP
jgi:outer membrane protein assembly factor BamB